MYNLMPRIAESADRSALRIFALEESVPVLHPPSYVVVLVWMCPKITKIAEIAEKYVLPIPPVLGEAVSKGVLSLEQCVLAYVRILLQIPSIVVVVAKLARLVLPVSREVVPPLAEDHRCLVVENVQTLLQMLRTVAAVVKLVLLENSVRKANVDFHVENSSFVERSVWIPRRTWGIVEVVEMLVFLGKPVPMASVPKVARPLSNCVLENVLMSQMIQTTAGIVVKPVKQDRCVHPQHVPHNVLLECCFVKDVVSMSARTKTIVEVVRSSVQQTRIALEVSAKRPMPV